MKQQLHCIYTGFILCISGEAKNDSNKFLWEFSGSFNFYLSFGPAVNESLQPSPIVSSFIPIVLHDVLSPLPSLDLALWPLYLGLTGFRVI